jgi:hypothetical protein
MSERSVPPDVQTMIRESLERGSKAAQEKHDFLPMPHFIRRKQVALTENFYLDTQADIEALTAPPITRTNTITHPNAASILRHHTYYSIYDAPKGLLGDYWIGIGTEDRLHPFSYREAPALTHENEPCYRVNFQYDPEYTPHSKRYNADPDRGYPAFAEILGRISIPGTAYNEVGSIHQQFSSDEQQYGKSIYVHLGYSSIVAPY